MPSNIPQTTPKSIAPAKRAPKSGLCRWKCRRKTPNRSGICDPCWLAAEKSRSLSEEGYKAWVERKKAKEAAARLSVSQKGSLTKANAARKAKRLADSLATSVSQAEGASGKGKCQHRAFGRKTMKTTASPGC